MMLAAIFTALIMGCVSSADQTNEYAAYDKDCERMALDYRTGHPEQLCFMEMTDYFKRRLGMPAKNLRALLGMPYVSIPQEMYYNYALDETIDLADEVGKLYPGTGYDWVLFYSELGPPDHWAPDESFNIVFMIKDQRVVAIKTLFP